MDRDFVTVKKLIYTVGHILIYLWNGYKSRQKSDSIKIVHNTTIACLIYSKLFFFYFCGIYIFINAKGNNETINLNNDNKAREWYIINFYNLL